VKKCQKQKEMKFFIAVCAVGMEHTKVLSVLLAVEQVSF
jgi:hypothetical protein